MRTRLLAAALLVAAAVHAQTPSTPPADLDAWVARTLRTFDVPGVAVTIVKDGRVLVARGYGVKRLGDPAPVDADTRFGIASNTKAFTAAAIGMLVEEGKLAWDAPVVRYLPAFAMYDPWVTRQITVRDLLVHRSGLGLGAGDLLWWPASTLDRKEIVRRLRYIPPATSFRSAYAYDNVLYSVAGELIEAVSGQTWEEFVQSRILVPLGMTHSTDRHSDAGRGDNVATTHAVVDGKLTIVAPMTSDNVNPAGGVNTGAADIATWLITQLDSGRSPDGRRLWTPATTRQLWTGVTPIPIGNPPAELALTRPNFQLYALGFDVQDYRGRKLVTHTGGLPGYVSEVMLVPDLRLGVAVLTNQESSAAFRSIDLHVVDHFLGAAPVDWIAAYKAVADRSTAVVAAAERSAVAARDTTSRPSLPLAKYAGTYTDPWYGDVTIADTSDKLVMRFSHTPELTGTLEHWQYDTFIARWNDRTLRADAYVTFSLNPDGTIDQVRLRSVSPATDFSFDFQDLLFRPAARR